MPELLRLLARHPKSRARDRIIASIVERLPHAASHAMPIEALTVSTREEQHLPVIEDAAKKRAPLRFHYFTASRGREGSRFASVHRVFPGPPARFVATCHRSGGLKWFRVDNVTDASSDASEPFRVREPEARWVARNLMSGMKADEQRDGIRVTVRTTAVDRVARWVVALGGAAECETDVLVERVAEIARAALSRTT